MNSDFKIRDEEIFLIRLCRLEFSGEESEKLKILASVIADWRYFADLANSHGVGALVYYNLEKLGFLQHVPQEAAEFLRNVMMLSLARNTRHLNEMKEVLNLLNKAGIKTVLLKGLALEISVYGNKGIRQMTDVDVLISRENCIRARKILLAGGFASLPVKSPFHKLIITHTGKHLPSLVKNGFSVEIHHELFGTGKGDLTRVLYNNSIETEISNEKVFIPATQIFLIYLVKHLNYHEMNNESQLRLYTDLAVLIEKLREDILNDGLITLADQAGIRKVFACKLGLLKEFWGISFPAQINDFILKWNDPDSTAKFVFFLRSPKGNPPPDKAVPYRSTLREIPGIHRKIIYLLGDLFPSIHFMKKRYNCSSNLKALLYYPHRIGKLWYLIKPSPGVLRDQG